MEINYKRINERMNIIYKSLYDQWNNFSDNSIPTLIDYIDMGDEVMKCTPEILKKVIQERQDIITSDREVLSYLLALATYCMDDKATDTFINCIFKYLEH